MARNKGVANQFRQHQHLNILNEVNTNVPLANKMTQSKKLPYPV